MPIPGAQSAFVPPEKLSDYLLNLNHPVGGAKARWFMSLGYHLDDPSQLEQALLQIVRESSDFVEEMTEFGVKYIVRGQLQSPRDRLVEVVTVWITETDQAIPRFVTAFPGTG